MARNKLAFLLLTLMLCVGVFCFPTLAAVEPAPERFAISTAWTDGDLLHIEIQDSMSGAISALELRLCDYAENCEVITIQVIDAEGNKSGVLRIANPHYVPPEAASDCDGSSLSEEQPLPVQIESQESVSTGTKSMPKEKGGSDDDIAISGAINSTASESKDGVTIPAATEPPLSESAVPGGSQPFTPDGTGAVIDIVPESHGKEFYTIGTEDGSVFFLIVDRQKSGDNVYLLSAVTESDLLPLAKKEDEPLTSNSVIPDPQPQPSQTETQPEPDPSPPSKSSGVNSGSLLLILLVVGIAGGVGYYFKVYRSKQQVPILDDEGEDFDDDSDEENEEWEEEESE